MVTPKKEMEKEEVKKRCKTHHHVQEEFHIVLSFPLIYKQPHIILCVFYIFKNFGRMKF